MTIVIDSREKQKAIKKIIVGWRLYVIGQSESDC